MILLKYCPSCEVELGDPNQNFCEKCGANLDVYKKEGKIGPVPILAHISAITPKVVPVRVI